MRSYRKVDDKGNRVPDMSIVTDTREATRTYQPEPDYYLVIDRDTVYKLAGKPEPVTFERLRQTGYIKMYKRVNRIARETARKKPKEGENE